MSSIRVIQLLCLARLTGIHCRHDLAFYSAAVCVSPMMSYICWLDVGVEQKNRSKVDRYRRRYTEPGCQILILYATEYGFSKELACELFDR